MRYDRASIHSRSQGPKICRGTKHTPHAIIKLSSTITRQSICKHGAPGDKHRLAATHGAATASLLEVLQGAGNPRVHTSPAERGFRSRALIEIRRCTVGPISDRGVTGNASTPGIIMHYAKQFTHRARAQAPLPADVACVHALECGSGCRWRCGDGAQAIYISRQPDRTEPMMDDGEGAPTGLLPECPE